jgi:hypothetical protein
VIAVLLSLLQRFAGPLVIFASIALSLWMGYEFSYERGYHARDQLVQQQVAAQREADAAAAVAAAAEDQRLVARVAANDVHARDVQTQLKAHLAVQATFTCSETTDALSKRPSLGAALLDADTVRLLNDARGLPVVPAASQQPDQVGAATPVGGADLALSDADLAKRYQDLATRHDALVDYVNAYKKRLPQ